MIAIITPVYPPYGGGIGRVAREDARVLSSAGNKVVIFTSCKHRKLKFGNASVLLDLIWKLSRFNVVHLHYPFFGTAEIVWLMKKLGLLRAKLVITYHMDVVGSGALGKFFKFHTKYIMPHIVSSADKTIVTSFDYAKNSNIKKLVKEASEKFTAIPIGVDDTLFRPRNKNKELLKKLKIKDDEKIALFVGGLDKAHYFKGLPFLLKAFKELEDKKYKLIVVGKGELEAEYKNDARKLGLEERVIFVGGPTRNDLLKYYNLADVFVLPSIDKSEAFGIVLLEAMASGVPIIASNLCGVRTLIEEGKNGFVAPVKDAQKLAEKIDEILSSREKIKKMGEHGRRIVEERYSYKKVGEQLLKFYSSVIPPQAGIHPSVIPAPEGIAEAGIHKKKICLINNLYGKYSRGGAERVVELLEKGLKEKGHEVFIISSRPKKEQVKLSIKTHGRRFLSTEEEQGGYSFFPLNLCWYGNLDKYGIFFRLVWHIIDTFNLHSFFVVKQILKKERPDIVWTHNLKGLGHLIPRTIKQLGIKHIHTLHDVQLSEPSGLIEYGVGNRHAYSLQMMYEKICKYLFGSPDIVISPSKWLMNFYTEKGFFKKSKKLVIPNPICHCEEFVAIAKDDVAISSKYKYLDVLFLGQIEKHKGILFAINALLSARSTKWRLHIVGDGSKLEKINKITEGDERFVVYGRKEGEELEKIWQKMDLMIFPSNVYENYPTVILESIVHGVPVVASDIGGVGELLNKTFLFEPNNEKEFLQRIDWCINNPEKIKCFINKKREGLRENMVENYLRKIL